MASAPSDNPEREEFYNVSWAMLSQSSCTRGVPLEKDAFWDWMKKEKMIGPLDYIPKLSGLLEEIIGAQWVFDEKRLRGREAWDQTH
jgi:hypothetical protein